MEKLCQDLTSTYDTNILDNESDIVKKEFLNVSLKNRNNKGNKVLMQLICNHYDKSVQKPSVEFIGGPKTLSIHWHSGFKKMIYIFGEWHANITDCDKFEKDANTILVEDYLYNLMLTTDVFLDIYFEFLSYKGVEYEYEPYAPGRSDELFKKFRKCIQYNTRSDASCKLARVHYFDIRSNDLEEINIEENKISILWFKQKISSIISIFEKERKDVVFYLKLLLKKYPKIITLLKQLVQDDIKKVCKFMKKQLEENTYIKKELSKINNPQIKPFILNFYGKLICEEVSRVIPIIKKDILNILNYEKISEDIFLQSMDSLSLFLGSTMVIFADVYLIARLFKDFDMEKIKDKSYFDQPNRAHNIIIYCGDKHANNYRNFLSSIGFHDIEHTGDLTGDPRDSNANKTTRNCLDMRKIKQPFFSYSKLPTTSKIVPKI